MLRVAFFTLGCKVNQYETSVLQEQFLQNGFSVVPPEQQADVYIVNSCTVTAGGDKKSRQMLRRFRRQNPSALTVLCGCFPQAFPEDAAAIPEADIIAGTRDRTGLLALVTDKLSGAGQRVNIVRHEQGEPFELMHLSTFSERTRAFVKIQDGCERRCAYCIIPDARGPVRSKPLPEIKAELEALAQAGYPEVVLVGINLSSYGLDIGSRLIDAVQLACGVLKDGRVRLGSLEPELLTKADIGALAKLENFCPQFHLSLQSGCDATLRRMRRPYDTAEYRRIVADLREAFPVCAITTDLMVGFPGETDAEFEQSVQFADEIGFARTHVFAYSRRPGTPADTMPEQVPEAVKVQRAKLMAQAAEKSAAAFLREQVGKTVQVVFETKTPDGLWEGYSEAYVPVRMASEDELGGITRTVQIEQATETCCIGIQSGL